MAMFSSSEIGEWNADDATEILNQNLFSGSPLKIKKGKKKLKTTATDEVNSNKLATIVSKKRLYQKRRKKWQLDRRQKAREARKLESSESTNLSKKDRNLKLKVDDKNEHGDKNHHKDKLIIGHKDAPNTDHSSMKEKKQQPFSDNVNVCTESPCANQRAPYYTTRRKDKSTLTDMDAPNTSHKQTQNKVKDATCNNLQKKVDVNNEYGAPKKRERNKYKHLAGKGKRAKQLALGINDIPETIAKNESKGKPESDNDLKKNLYSRSPEVHSISKKKKKHKCKETLEYDQSPGKKARLNEAQMDTSSKKKKRKKDTESWLKSPSKSPFDIVRLKDVLQSNKQSSSVKTKPVEQLDDSSEKRDNIKKKPVKRTDSNKKSDYVEKKPVHTTLRQRMQEKLKSARFRFLNEQLYTTTSSEAKHLFQQDRESFFVYHEGFQSQVEKWPVNPVEKMISHIKSKPKSMVIADFGCGDAKLAQGVSNKVHSFDLVAVNEYVTACDMANVPLKVKSVDIAVFCLSLMGTNLLDFLCEANRVLKCNGTLLVAEVVSRFEKIGSFTRKLGNLGFTLHNKDASNKMFVWLEFTKSGDVYKDKGLPKIELMPCIYKKR